MNNHIDAYPLCWPVGRKRTRYPERARFRCTMGAAIVELREEVERLGGRDLILSTNIPTRLDGFPYASARHPDDPGVAVYFTYKGKQHCFACDQWDRVEHNVRAIQKTIEALRGIARWGTGDMMQRAFDGFAALPSPEAEPWWSVLGFSSSQGVAHSEVEARAKSLMQKFHPDREGGDEWRFKQVVKARDEFRHLSAEDSA